MTTKFSWNELKKLVVLDHEINQLKKAIHTAQQELESIKVPLATIAQNRDQQATLIRETQKHIDALELSLAQLQQDEIRKKEILETLSHPKEYNALEREIAELEQQINDVEDKIVAQLEQQEAAQKEHDTALNAYKEAEAAAKEKGHETTQLIAEREEEIDALEAQWEEQLKLVPSDLSRGYAEIRARVPNPVVPVVSSSCSACFYGLLHQDNIALTTRSVIRCRGCYRFLFAHGDAPIPTEAS